MRVAQLSAREREQWGRGTRSVKCSAGEARAEKQLEVRVASSRAAVESDGPPLAGPLA